MLRKRLEELADETEREARAILGWWTRHAVDRERGGFYGEIDALNRPLPDAPKGIVLNTRILWFFSEAAAFLGDLEAKALSNRAADYVWTRFLDAQHGGMYWLLDAHGQPLDHRKQGYAQAFGVYALCAHHRATGDTGSLTRAQALFALVEQHYLDHARGGYIEALARDWSAIADMRLSEVDRNCPKSANTHLHLLEAFTAIHVAAPSTQTHAALARCIGLFLDRFVDETKGHLRLFFEHDWRDCSPTISYGHDIEASWLIWSGCEALKDDALSRRARSAVLALAKSCRDEAMADGGGIANERMLDGARDDRRVWWVQAEAMVGFLNAFALSGDESFLSACEAVWDFIKRNHRAADHGEWSWWSALDRPDANRRYKAGMWKGPYHNGRAMLEATARLRRIAEFGAAR